MDSSADPLISLRRSIASNAAPIATILSDATDASSTTEDLAIATYLQFEVPERHVFSLDTPTRFISSEKPVDLRSIYFAWLKKDVAIPDYISSTQELNEELAGKSTVQNLVFVERLDLITWLEGASEESEYIKVSEADAAAKSAQVASGAAGGVSTVPSSGAGLRPGKQIDPRLQEIYNGERRMGDRNSILRGIKPTVSEPATVICDFFSVFGHLLLSCRTSRMSVNRRRYFSPALEPLQSAPVLPPPPPPKPHPNPPPLPPIPRNPLAGQTPSYCSPHPPPPYCACQTLNPSSSQEPTSRPTRPSLAPQVLQPLSCTSHAYSRASTHTVPYASSSLTPQSNSSPITGTVWLQYLLQGRRGSSRATNGRMHQTCLGMRSVFMLVGEERTYQAR